jgi:hypothetical protein
LLERSTHSGNGASFAGVGWSGGESTELVEERLIRDASLSEEAGLGHHTDSSLWVRSLSSLSRQHYAVGAIKNSICNVRDLGTSWTGVVGHGLEHLGSTNDWLSGQVALGDHHLLSDEDLGRWDLNTEITTSNHDTVSLPQDLVKVVKTLLVLNLGNDLNFPALLSENLSDGGDITSTTNERSKDHVDVVLDTKLQVGNVLLGEWWEIDIGLWEVDTLLGRDLSVVQALGLDGLFIDNLEDLKGENTIVDVDNLLWLNDLGDVLIVNIPKARR